MEALERLIARLRELLDEHERDPASFEIHATPAGTRSVDTYRRLEELGVTDAGTLPILLEGGNRMDAPTRQRLTGAPVEAARDPEAIYSKAPPELKLEAVRQFSKAVISHWRAR